MIDLLRFSVYRLVTQIIPTIISLVIQFAFSINHFHFEEAKSVWFPMWAASLELIYSSIDLKKKKSINTIQTLTEKKKMKKTFSKFQTC